MTTRSQTYRDSLLLRYMDHGVRASDRRFVKVFWFCLRCAVLVCLTVGVSGCQKIALDNEVRRLCAVDGGIKVHEVVAISSDRFNRFGTFYVPAEELAKPTDEFYYVWETTYYRRGNPAMWRSHFKLYRRSDKKLLGEAIRYARRGGDIPGPWHESSFGCPAQADITDVTRNVFAPRNVER